MSLCNKTVEDERRGWQNTCMWQTWQANYLCVLWWSSLKLMCSGLLQKDLFKGGWSSADKFFKQNYCHACHTRFIVFFPLPSCCVSSLIITWRGGGLSGQIQRDKNFLCWLKELDQLNRIWPSFSACSRCCHSSLLLKQKILYISYM